MNILLNNLDMNPDTATFGRMKTRFPSDQRRQLPTLTDIRKKELLLDVEDFGCRFQIYQDGYIVALYPDDCGKKRVCRTSFSRVRLNFSFCASMDEMDEESGSDADDPGMRTAFCRQNHWSSKMMTVEDWVLESELWTKVLCYWVSEIKITNQDKRNEYRSDYSFEAQSTNAGWKMSSAEKVQALSTDQVNQALQKYFEDEQEAANLELLRTGMAILPEKHKKVLELYFSMEKPSQTKVARQLNLSLPSVHKYLALGVAALSKHFGLSVNPNTLKFKKNV